MKEAENCLLAKKLELDQNKSKTLEKPCDAIKEIQTIAEKDNASTLLADSRFIFRTEPKLKPKEQQYNNNNVVLFA